jgi:hypothetical protein
MEFSQTTGFSHVISWSPFSLGVLLLGMCAILFGPRKWVLPAFLTLSILMSFALHIVLLGQNLMPHRVLLICAWTRFLIRGEHRGLVLSAIDKALILFCSCLVITETLQVGTAGFIYAVANSGLDALGTYFLGRVLIRDKQDLQRGVRTLGVLCAIVGACMLVEFTMGRNLLNALGAVQDTVVSREGRIRCAASFGISITAGTFGAVLVPFFIACWWQEGSMKKWAIPGCIASTVVTLASSSASPLSTYLLAIIGMVAWPWRSHMRKIRWATVAALVVLHFIMNGPVWALIARVQIVPGASAYHRFNLIDTFVRHIDEWWLYGVTATDKWGWDMDDVANQYCMYAKHGGLVGLFLFVRVLSLGFREVGRALHVAMGDKPTGIFIWAFGVTLFAHATAFFGISYYDQTKISWYVTFAMIASVRLLVSESVDVPSVEFVEEHSTQNHGLGGSLPAEAQ